MSPAQVYRRYTGGDRDRMLANLRLLLALVGPERILVRLPLIPGYSSPDMQEKDAEALRALGVSRLDLFSYVVRED